MHACKMGVKLFHSTCFPLLSYCIRSKIVCRYIYVPGFAADSPLRGKLQSAAGVDVVPMKALERIK